MAWMRLLYSGVTLMATAIGGWAAWQAAHSSRNAGDEVVMLVPGAPTVLNPYLPCSEAERQILELIHEPLIRIDREGRLATALAEQWQWRQDMTCWFDSAEAARAATQELRDQPVEKRASWDLESVVTQGEALVVRFLRPGAAVADEVREVLAASRPQNLTFMRIAAPRSARLSLQSFAEHPLHAPSTKRLWFDDDGTCEIVTSRSGLQAQQALLEWLAPRHHPVPEITPVGEVTALLEPVLDFRLKPDLRWPDGSPVSAADVRATLEEVMPRPAPLPGRDAFRQIQSIAAPEPGIVRVTYRKAYSPALPAWTTLPILPQSWLKKHTMDFEQQSPPGAGAWKLSRREGSRFWLERRQDHSSGPAGKIQILGAISPMQTRIGLATGSFDIAWLQGSTRTLLESTPQLKKLSSPARHQIMLVWQTSGALTGDLKVRQALGMALDREGLRRAMPGGLGRSYDSFFPPGFWFSTTPQVPPARISEALRLLAEAGWLRDVGGRLRRGQEELTLRFVIPDGNVDRLRLAQAIASQWLEIGARAEIVEVPAQSYLMELQSGRFDAAVIGGELSPGWDVLPFWHSGQSGGLGPNVSQLRDPKLDLLLEALVAEFDPARVPERAAEVEKRLRELQPALPLFTDLAEIAVRESRFPGLPRLDATQGVTLQELLPALQVQGRPEVKLRMLSPP